MTTVGELLDSKGHEVWSIGPSSSVYEALEMMADKNVSGLLILDGSQLVGIFTERDYARKLVLQGRISRDTNVSDLMTKKVLYVKPSNTVSDCMNLMTAKRIRHLPVIDQEQLVGILTIGDLVKQIISEQQSTIDQMDNYITGSY